MCYYEYIFLYCVKFKNIANSLPENYFKVLCLNNNNNDNDKILSITITRNRIKKMKT